MVISNKRVAIIACAATNNVVIHNLWSFLIMVLQGNSSIGAATSQENVCDICTLSCKREEMDGLECGHLFCKQCWNSYLRVMIVDEGRSVTSLCSLCVVYYCFCSVVLDYLLCLYIL